MKKIILASASAQRKKLLKTAQIPFITRPSKVQEETHLKGGCAALVKHNAYLKADDIAKKVSNGIIIGADTLVYSSRSGIISKPKNLKEARHILKILFSRPHWVYTGVAVIDAKTGKKIIDYDKTKVFMRKLTNDEIKRYHRKTNPLDKAGGFDIEGRGGLFIHRIEGCYANVIGLPMSKLRLMLKKLGVNLL